MTSRRVHGRCKSCGIVWAWPSKQGRVRYAWCPMCGKKLATTTVRRLKANPIIVICWPIISATEPDPRTLARFRAYAAREQTKQLLGQAQRAKQQPARSATQGENLRTLQREIEQALNRVLG